MQGGPGQTPPLRIRGLSSGGGMEAQKGSQQAEGHKAPRWGWLGVLF